MSKAIRDCAAYELMPEQGTRPANRHLPRRRTERLTRPAARALGRDGAIVLAVAFVFQYLGLLAERWYFRADANHPQNLYHQAIS